MENSSKKDVMNQKPRLPFLLTLLMSCHVFELGFHKVALSHWLLNLILGHTVNMRRDEPDENIYDRGM